MRVNDLSDKRFGKLYVIGYAGNDKHRKALWHCVCDCGIACVIVGNNMAQGSSKSCGCTMVKHGHMTGNVATRTYRSWKAMMTRCYNTHCDDWPEYGGRGISVWEVWHDFRAFFLWMGERPQAMTLDRIHNEIGYNPFNCRWASLSVQNANRRPWASTRLPLA